MLMAAITAEATRQHAVFGGRSPSEDCLAQWKTECQTGLDGRDSKAQDRLPLLPR